MAEIKRFFECLIPITVCNIKCDYCYVVQRNWRKLENFDLRYSPKHMAESLSKKRLGGTCFFNICGAGETLLARQIVELIYELLKEGHYVSITNNGTITERFKQIAEFPKDFLERLHFCFSFHYLELKKHNLLDTFFNNFKFIRDAGCSVTLKLNLYDKYIDCVDELKQVCIDNLGALPQIELARDESEKITKIMTKRPIEEYKKVADSFNSTLFDFTYNNFLVKRNKDFCYAGDWSFSLNLLSGELRKCYNAEIIVDDIFKDIDKPIKFEAIGHSCKCEYCGNCSFFLSLGCIPSLKTPTFFELRNRDNVSWYSDKMKEVFSHKLNETNKEYSKLRQRYIILRDFVKLSFQKKKYKILSKIALTEKKRNKYKDKLYKLTRYL